MSLRVRDKTTKELYEVANQVAVDSFLSSNSTNPVQNKEIYFALRQKVEATTEALVNYYLKTDTYSKNEVDAIVSAIASLTIKVVAALPTQDISTTTLYFVGPQTGTTIYEQYVRIDDAWVNLGSTDVDLSGYVTDSDLAALTIGDLYNIEIVAPTDGQVLTYDATNSKWVNSDGSGVVASLDDIGDVDLTSLVNGQTIVWDETNSKWVNASIPSAIDELNDISDVDITNPSDGDVLTYDASNGVWVNGNGVAIDELGDIADVNLANLVDGQIIVWDATTSKWVNSGFPAFDASLSSSSENAVQNKVVKEALDDKQDVLTFDSAPIEDSENPVTSDGIFESEKSIYEVMGKQGAKNLIAFPYDNGNYKETADITFTVSSEGNILANGTASGNANFLCAQITIKPGEYILTGCQNIYSPNKIRCGIATTSWSTLYQENGNGVKFTISTEQDVFIYVGVLSGATVTDEPFKPMLRLADDVDDTWRPFAMTNKQLTDKAIKSSTLEINRRTGVKNFIYYPFYQTTRSANGIDWTDNGDGTITADGTASALEQFSLSSRIIGIHHQTILPNGTYILSDGVDGSSGTTWEIQLGCTKNGAYQELAKTRNGDAEFTIDGDDEFTDRARIAMNIVIRKDVVCDNLVFKPMIRLKDDVSTEWVGYAKTNQQLTNEKAEEDAVFNECGAKNLLPYNYYSPNGYSHLGITYTVNSDGSITANGTATGNSQFFFDADIVGNKTLKVGSTYILSGCVGGSSSTYKLFADKYDGLFTLLANQYDGEDQYFTVPNDADFVRIGLTIYSGTTVEDLTFYPMVRSASIRNSSYQPSAKTNRKLTEDKAEEDAVFNLYGAKNLLNTTLAVSNNTSIITKNADESITIAATSLSGEFYYPTINNTTYAYTKLYPNLKPNKLYVFSVGEQDYGSIQVYYMTSDTWILLTQSESGASELMFRTPSSYNNIWIRYGIPGSTTISSAYTIYPMLRPAEISDTAYAPYAMTNRELTVQLQELNDAINASY